MEQFIEIIDQDNKIKIPQRLLNILNWQSGITVKFSIEGNGLLINSVADKCVFCGEDTQDLFMNKPLCKRCRNLITTTQF